MKPLSYACLFSTFAILCSWAGVAQADLPPPDDYVETCTLDQRQGPGLSCVECFASFEDPNACDVTWSAQGYNHVCRSYGASAWTEVWCQSATGTGEGTGSDTGAQHAAPRPAINRGGCSVGGSWDAWAVPVGLVLLGLVASPWLRRRSA
jgi:MYXO-CTERM domain-containing protein